MLKGYLLLPEEELQIYYMVDEVVHLSLAVFHLLLSSTPMLCFSMVQLEDSNLSTLCRVECGA